MKVVFEGELWELREFSELFKMVSGDDNTLIEAKLDPSKMESALSDLINKSKANTKED